MNSNSLDASNSPLKVTSITSNYSFKSQPLNMQLFVMQNMFAIYYKSHCTSVCIYPKRLRMPLKMHITLLDLFPSPSHAFSQLNHLFASSSAHTVSILSRFSLAASRFSLVRSSLCARRHLLTWYFASVQLPVTFQRKPRAWHSSRAATTSAQSSRGSAGRKQIGKGSIVTHFSVFLRCGDVDALCVLVVKTLEWLRVVVC